MLRDVCAPLAKAQRASIDVVTFDDLVIEAARRAGATLMIRGLRDGTDLDYEMQMAGMNGAMAPDIATVFLPASPMVRPITATLVRQIAKMKGDVSPFVPPPWRGNSRQDCAAREASCPFREIVDESENRGGRRPRAHHGNSSAGTGRRSQQRHCTRHQDGRIIIKLRPDLAPKHVAQITTLTKRGFYDGIVFHRVIDGFMAQTGDPTAPAPASPTCRIFPPNFPASRTSAAASAWRARNRRIPPIRSFSSAMMDAAR